MPTLPVAGWERVAMSNSSQALSSLDRVYIASECLIALLATLGNVLVIWVVKLNSSFQNTTLYFIASLALADVAVAILVVPLAIVVSLGVRIRFHACLFMCCLMVAFTNASILSLLAIAIDRYLRVKLPTRYKTITRERRVWWALAACWSVSLLAGLLPMLGWNEREPGGPGFVACAFTSVMSMEYMVYFCFLTCTLLPLLVMCALYLEVFHVIRTKLSNGSSSVRGAGGFYGQEIRTARSLALVLFLFVVSWLPLCILNCIYYFCSECEIPQCVLYLGILLSHLNSAMNPIVYACKVKKFRSTYLFILRSYILCKKPDADLMGQTTTNSSK